MKPEKDYWFNWMGKGAQPQPRDWRGIAAVFAPKLFFFLFFGVVIVQYNFPTVGDWVLWGAGASFALSFVAKWYLFFTKTRPPQDPSVSDEVS